MFRSQKLVHIKVSIYVPITYNVPPKVLKNIIIKKGKGLVDLGLRNWKMNAMLDTVTINY